MDRYDNLIKKISNKYILTLVSGKVFRKKINLREKTKYKYIEDTFDEVMDKDFTVSGEWKETGIKK